MLPKILAKVVDKTKQLLISGNVQELLTRYADILLAFLVVGMVGMLILPMPTWLLDIIYDPKNKKSRKLSLVPVARAHVGPGGPPKK